ncbi:protein of unknown function [Paenibacillus alvei]|uniref:Uncharacterized protein n=1 Tax=Paenibacillus alvei TaxID=44250 RepID=A0A383R531_PAEAL|nr:protein of unknown function [Paenibacillus alvei]
MLCSTVIRGLYISLYLITKSNRNYRIVWNQNVSFIYI